MFQQDKATSKIVRAKLKVISQTEENRDRFFVGEAEEFFDADGTVN